VLVSALVVSGYAISTWITPQTPPSAYIPTHAGIRIENFSYSAPGPRPWELYAPSAEVSESLDEVILRQPHVIYHGGEGGRISLSSQTGSLNRKTLSVAARGDVTLKYKDYVFHSSEMNYSHEKLSADTSTPVSFDAPDLSLTGRGLSVSLKNEEIVIENDVKAKLFNLRFVENKGGPPM
jgi:LPS export ABC transporter protein LptC